MNPPLNKFELVILRETKRLGEKVSVHWSNHVQIDGRMIPMGVIDYKQLVRSLSKEGEFFVTTCGCGEPGCAGIHDGIEVSHRNGRSSWRMNFTNPVCEFTFNTTQYREAIYHGLLAWRRQITQKTGWLQLGPLFFNRNDLDACVREAENACGGLKP